MAEEIVVSSAELPELAISNASSCSPNDFGCGDDCTCPGD